MNTTSKQANHKEFYFIPHSECEAEQDDFVVIFKAFYEGYLSRSDKYYPPRCSDITQKTCSCLAGAKKITKKSRRDLSTLDFFASFLHQGKNEEAVGMTGNDVVGGTMVSGVSGGVGSMLAGGDFGQGFQAGAYRHLYNEMSGDFLNAIDIPELRGMINDSWKAMNDNPVISAYDRYFFNPVDSALNGLSASGAGQYADGISAVWTASKYVQRAGIMTAVGVYENMAHPTRLPSYHSGSGGVSGRW